MEKAIEFIKKPWVIGGLAFIVGLFIGLVVLGWGLWPVQWYDGDFTDLRPDLQDEYLRTAIALYAKDPAGLPAAVKSWENLGEKGPDALARVKAAPAPLTMETVLAFENAVAPQIQVPEATPGTGGAAPRTTSSILIILGIMCVVTLLLAVALIAFFLLRGKSIGGPAPISAYQAEQQAKMTDYSASGEEPPMAQFMASYKLGDDLFDDSFSIDSPAGEFLGECGVGISETIGVGDPKKVTAFEVWLFDKNDIQTVTKVLMSAHAFNDEATKTKLSAKGEPTLSQPGQQVVLETATLQLVARVVDMSYGEGALPPESFFNELILELAVWQK